MKTLALLYTVNGVCHCLIDTALEPRLDGRLQQMRALFPGNNPRLVTVEVTEWPSVGTAETLRPPPEPNFGATSRTSPLRCREHGGIGFSSDCIACHPPREPLATLPEIPR